MARARPLKGHDDSSDEELSAAEARAKKEQRKRQARRYRITQQQQKLWQQHTPSEDLMQKLPAELRNEIYGLVLLDKNSTMHLEAGKWKEPALLRTSKQIRAEASAMFFHGKTFQATVGVYQLNGLRILLQSIQQRCGFRASDVDIEIYVKACKHEEIASLLPLAFITYEYPRCGFFNYTRGYAGEACMEVAALGTQARLREQREYVLGVMFDEWLECKLEKQYWKRSYSRAQYRVRRRDRRTESQEWSSEEGDTSRYSVYLRNIKQRGDRVESWKKHEHESDGEFKSTYMKKAARLEPSTGQTRSMTSGKVGSRRWGKRGRDDRFV